VAALAVVGLVAAAPTGSVAGAEYEMATKATYVVDDAADTIRVTVDIAFRNTFAPPAGQISQFPQIRLAIHDHAAAVTASDAGGALTVAAGPSGGVNVATITPRSPVKYGETAQITLAYELRDGDNPAVRVGPHLISFPAWGFGTSSEVRVDLPATFEVRVDGDPMEAAVEGDRAILTSGPIPDPTRWLSHVGATRDAPYETIQRTVPLEGGTADVQVRHWEDDPEWGADMADLVARALPRLEAVFGVPYPGTGPLVITETVTAGTDLEAEEGGIAVGFTEPPFTAIHQVAHTWAGQWIAGDRWLVEGLASWAAAAVSAEMEIDLPHDPAAVAESLKADAFPLAEWDADDLPAAAEGWAYAAAWSLTAQAAGMTGPEAFQAALRRIATGLDGYDPDVEAEAATASLSDTMAPPTLTSRAFLDHLDAVTDQPVVEALAAPVLGDEATAELEARARARTALDGLRQAAGEWADPEPVRSAMVAWQFEVAEREIAEAQAWLAARDALLDDLARVGLTAPERLSAAYHMHGGGTEAWAEIDAEAAVADAYGDAAAVVAEGLDPAAHVGFLLAPTPEERLATAATTFAAGDLRGSADELAALDRDLATATAGGLVRLLGVVVAVGAALLLAAVAMRRRRTGTDYTPEP
jgi:hypothetical protein